MWKNTHKGLIKYLAARAVFVQLCKSTLPSKPRTCHLGILGLDPVLGSHRAINVFTVVGSERKYLYSTCWVADGPDIAATCGCSDPAASWYEGRICMGPGDASFTST